MKYGNVSGDTMVDLGSCCFQGCAGCNIYYGLFKNKEDNGTMDSGSEESHRETND